MSFVCKKFSNFWKQKIFEILCNVCDQQTSFVLNLLKVHFEWSRQGLPKVLSNLCNNNVWQSMWTRTWIARRPWHWMIKCCIELKFIFLPGCCKPGKLVKLLIIIENWVLLFTKDQNLIPRTIKDLGHFYSEMGQICAKG